MLKSKFKRCLEKFIFIVNICGAWHLFKEHGKACVIFSTMTVYFALVNSIVVQATYVIVHKTNRDKLMWAMSMTMIALMTCAKVLVFLRHRKRIERLLNFTDVKKFTCNGPESLWRLQHRFTWVAIKLYLFFQLLQILNTFVGILHAILSGKDKNDEDSIVRSWFPYEQYPSPYYEIIFIHNAISLLLDDVYEALIDDLLFSFMAVASCEFEILNTRIKNIGDDVQQFGKTEYLTMKMLVKKDIDKRLYKELIKCVEHHLVIIEYAMEFEKNFQFVLFIKLLKIYGIIGMTTFSIAQYREYSLASIAFGLMYATSMAYQLFMYCYFGNSVSVQVFNILWRQNRIKTLLDIVASDGFSRYNSQYEHILSSYTFGSISHHAAYQSFGAVAVFCWAFTPIADLIAGRSRRLPMEAWYPYNTTSSPAFELTCVHQTIAVIFACFHNVAMDTLVTGLITVACCQLEILKSNLHQLGKDPLKPTMSIARNVEDEVKNYIEHHNAIIDFLKEVEAIFGTTVFFMFLVNCIIICLTAFHITKMTVFQPAELIGMTMYTCCMTYQIFIYCWHGNKIVFQSESVVNAAYFGNWWRCSERYKRALRLLMARANRPFVLRAGYILPLSLSTFISVLKASYSFFTVLQSARYKI